MNLELLDPFQRQIPDRVDATLSIPAFVHTRYHHHDSTNHATASGRKSQQQQQQLQHPQDDDEWKAVYHVAYNRRGTYVAAGYASGVVGVYDVLSRTLTAIFPGNTEEQQQSQESNNTVTPNRKQQQEQTLGNGVTSLSWSRRSRTLLAGAIGDSLVRLYDNTHPYGPEESTNSLVTDEGKDSFDHHHGHDKDDEKPHHSNPRASPSITSQVSTPGDRPAVRRSTFSNLKASYLDYATEPRILKTGTITYVSQPGDRSATPAQSSITASSTKNSNNNKRATMSPALFFHFPKPIGGSLEVHPRYATGGLAVLSDGSLLLFWVPESAWWEKEHHTNGSFSAQHENDDNHQQTKQTPYVRLWTLWNDTASNIITCASFDPQGQRIYAATKEGTLMGFEIGSVFEAITAPAPQEVPPCEKQCRFTIRIPGGATVWHLIVSRDGKFLVINCADGALRLYSTKDCWQTPEQVEKPSQVFQDVVNKVRFVSCAVSGDGEYVVGGANGISDDKYELYIWSASTGALMDKLTGAAVQLYSVAWHPTRSFLAIATSDGLIDIWGPRINWTAFAPDFQALPMNVEYVEREDEFDLDEDGNKIEPKEEQDAETDDENILVDVVTIEPVPVFASDSEDEEDVFYFETKFTNFLGGRAGRHSLLPGGKAAYDDG